ncbi:unnamed protein product [Schistosoma rodhaini]|uniref:Sh3-containing grb2-like protein 1 (Endophilin II) n=2 Tax=Schistosoma mansoni TaxID=6183 RepID=A0A3Q0KKB5_SCHMA|nr:unnamed protein product [Schistosoma rodhaini]
MSFSTIKKHIARCNQFLSEKLGATKGMDKGPDYKQLTQLMDSYKAFYEDIQKRVIDCLEPNPNARKRAWANAAVNKIQGTTSNDSYPHAEKILSDCFLEYGRQLSQQSDLSLALTQCGEAYNKIVESKNQSVDETKSGYLKLISEKLHRDIRKISALRKKVENKRLTLAHRKNVLERTKAQPDQAFEESRIQYEDALAASTTAMSNFLDTEVEQIKTLSNFVNAQLSFYQDAARILSDLHGGLEMRLLDARDHARRQTPYPISSNNALPDIPSLYHDSANFQMKPKYDDHSNRTPQCVALYDFNAESPFELSFCKGDSINLIEQIDDNWYLGELNGQEGHFPTNFVHVTCPLP